MQLKESRSAFEIPAMRGVIRQMRKNQLNCTDWFSLLFTGDVDCRQEVEPVPRDYLTLFLVKFHMVLCS